MSTANEIGARLRRQRQSRGLSLRAVAQELKVSASLISQVETGKTQPSVATLYSLATLLSISVDELLGLEPAGTAPSRLPMGSVVQRASENPVIEMENGVRWEKLAMGPGGPADVLLVTYQPGAASSIEGRLMRHVGLEYAYLLEGSLTLQVEFDTYELNAGDSWHFDSSRPHMASNHGATPAIGIWFVVGRHGDSLPNPQEPPVSSRQSARSTVDVLRRLDALDVLEE
ncbi:helix-turn-helix domain-containing protein [Microbacterium sp. LWS13-1.2]|uniref:Helix-turn-helix domain-containing protein n=1 Tax=Microbacterium sp. LWS13-1.2 TaxID=3135264 RepID=A0AAU6SBI6_9MICO